MPLHIFITVAEPELQNRLHQLLEKPDTFVETVKDHRRFWKKISRRTCDPIALSRDLIQDETIGELQNLNQLPEASLIIVLSEEVNEEEWLHLISAGCDAVLEPAVSKEKTWQRLKFYFRQTT